MIYIIIALLVLGGFVRTVSFGMWNLREKNLSGAIALFLLAVITITSSIINLLS